MIKKVDLELNPHKEVFASPTPLGLIGLAISCAALMPVAVGHTLTPAAFKTVAVLALLFGGGCQMITGLMEFANKNLFGGTIFTAFSFSWVYLSWSFYSLANGFMLDHSVALAVDAVLLVIFSILTYGFGFFSKLLFLFLLDIDLLYICKLVNGLTGTQALMMPIAFLTAGMGLIALWIAMATLINPVAGRSVFPIAGPLFFAPKKSRLFDFTQRYNIFDILYKHWQKNAYKEMELKNLQAAMKAKTGNDEIVHELFYLQEYGCMILTFDVFEKDKIHSLRLNAQGLDLYEQLVLKKYSWA